MCSTRRTRDANYRPKQPRTSSLSSDRLAPGHDSTPQRSGECKSFVKVERLGNGSALWLVGAEPFALRSARSRPFQSRASPSKALTRTKSGCIAIADFAQTEGEVR